MISIYNSAFHELPEYNGRVDLFLCDLPSGKTKKDWDKKLDLGRFWKTAVGLAHDTTAFLFFATPPFNFELHASNPSMYRYSWIWKKNRGSQYLNANRMPLMDYEEIMVFYKKLPTYNPQKTKGTPNHKTSTGASFNSDVNASGGFIRAESDTSGDKFPTRVIEFTCVPPSNSLHASQKPVSLLSYLIRTYTDKGGIVLDPTMGSGSTGVACVEVDRSFIGFETVDSIFVTAEARIKATSPLDQPPIHKNPQQMNLFSSQG